MLDSKVRVSTASKPSGFSASAIFLEIRQKCIYYGREFYQWETVRVVRFQLNFQPNYI